MLTGIKKSRHWRRKKPEEARYPEMVSAKPEIRKAPVQRD